MEAKEKPIGGVKTPTGNDKAGENPSAESIPYRLPYGQAVPFVAYEKVAGGAKGLVRLGQFISMRPLSSKPAHLPFVFFITNPCPTLRKMRAKAGA